jgi:hypothetical protein
MANKESPSYFEEGSGLEYLKLYKDMVNQYGLLTAAVFSVIANYSKQTMSGDKRCCTKSEVGIGNELQMSWSAVRKCIQILLDNNLIEKVNKNEIWGDEKLNSANWYRPVAKEVYLLKDKKKKSFPKSNHQRQQYQVKGREKIKKDKKKKEDKKDQIIKSVEKNIEEIEKIYDDNYDDNYDENSW